MHKEFYYNQTSQRFLYFVTCSLLEETRFAGESTLCIFWDRRGRKFFRDNATFPEMRFVLPFRPLKADAGTVPNIKL